ncbi:uncharacterized protein J4E84_008234 [Alternaria hordeiaustralica]|uniref:uncharacterized protein n=2 Tax=Alternaria sect. Infectoriae TaxID=2499258 RepID=UPI0020C2329A|nr:uncharacterized protein J4E84_008234 [Alternaria hordeiaustralica]KAI4679711.1 hypothetical protein J4E84_008234 [Alternaria hordeiaustralica]
MSLHHNLDVGKTALFNTTATGADLASPTALPDAKSPGVARIEALNAHTSFINRCCIFFGIFLIAYAYGLDGTLRYTYQPYATAGFQQHSTLATINVLRSVIAAAAQPTAAKIADVFGRIEVVILSMLFYIIGTVIESVSSNVESFAAGAVFYQIGYTTIIVLIEIIIADITSLRSRLFFSYIPAVPFLINTWVSGDPFTIAGGAQSQWGTAKVIAPLIIGFMCLPAFVLWERRAPHPMLPFHLLKDRAVWGALGIACTLNFAWTMQGDFLYTVLVVAFDESVKSATRISSLYSFSSVITGLILGGVVFKVRRLKPFIVAGTCLFVVAFGLLIYYRGGSGDSLHSGIIGAQICLGIAGGMFPYPAQASIQAATKHEHVAIVTGIYLATYNIGSALGNTVSGAMWQQIIPNELARRIGDPSLAAVAYGDPFAFATLYPVQTPERIAVIQAYRHVQKLLCITGICLAVLLVAFSLVIRNPELGKDQSLKHAEEDAEVNCSDSRS